MNTTYIAMFPSNQQKKRRRLIFTDVLFVDPGIVGTGWAFFPYIDTCAGKVYYPPSEYGAINPKRSFSEWDAKVADICTWFDGLCSARKPKIVVLEYQEMWGASATSYASVQKGDLLKLTFLTGGLAEVARRNGARIPILVQAKKWKGQLPKSVVLVRIGKRFPTLKTNLIPNHASDAIGMGLAAQGGL